MPAYLIANVISAPDGNEGMEEYRRRVGATLEPFDARFVVRGGTSEAVEGGWQPGHLSIIEFPSKDHFHRWYDSDAYQEILPLRTDNVRSELVIVE